MMTIWLRMDRMGPGLTRLMGGHCLASSSWGPVRLTGTSQNHSNSFSFKQYHLLSMIVPCGWLEHPKFIPILLIPALSFIVCTQSGTWTNRSGMSAFTFRFCLVTLQSSQSVCTDEHFQPQGGCLLNFLYYYYYYCMQLLSLHMHRHRFTQRPPLSRHMHANCRDNSGMV